MMAIVSLRQQRVTVYDREGPILQAPVSTGQTGYETPAGIYSVLEKHAEHYSNLYDDASMPFMQRITWSGIALHAGALPGYPASHGCVRMPHGFAERLFQRTKLGMRVIVVRDDIKPVEFTHPALFKPLGDADLARPGALEQVSTQVADASAVAHALPAIPRRSLRATAADKSAAAAAAAAKAEEARLAARSATIESARATKAMRRAQGAKARAELQLRRAEQLAARAQSTETAAQRLQEAKAAAQAAFDAAQAQLERVQAETQSKVDLALQLRQQSKAAHEASATAQEEAKDAARKLSPVSVFISRAMQRLYVRQAREPLFESPVSIDDPERPLGTYVFTALAYTDGEADLRWNVVSMYRTREQIRPDGTRPRGGVRHAAASPADLDGARLALERIAIPKETVERISEMVAPGAALIVSDESLSRETGKATEFIVVMSTEAQGGIKIRRRSPAPEARYRYQRRYGGSPFGWSGRGPWWW